MLHPSFNIFRDNCIFEFDLQRLQDYLTETHTPSSSASSTTRPSNSSAHLMYIVREADLIEQGLEPFDPALLKPLQSLPPGKLPGNLVSSAIYTNSDLPILFQNGFAGSSAANTNTATNSLLPGKQSASSTDSSPNSPKKRKVDSSQQNITIQHF